MKKTIEVKGMITVDKEGLKKITGGETCASGSIGTCATFILVVRNAVEEMADYKLLIY